MSAYSLNENRPSDGQPVALVVDDMPSICRLMALILREGGYQVSTASTGSEALDLAHNLAQLDVLVSDVDMPGMRGDELAHRLRDIHPEAAVVFVSGGTRHLNAPQPSVFVPKPFTIDHLLDAVREALKMRPRLQIYSTAA